ncbi:hypothetical protein TIFTF001_050365 [Ficus carica]|uniref:Uncharacterized protein n=1 Tax=Ficus carica TaxID=3494 RepID=A0AA87ZJB1_FICCA|nr:hypothetical protein TIFTF001_050365 [Ficus carica]
MRLQRPQFRSKPEPDRAQNPCTARIGATGHMIRADLNPRVTQCNQVGQQYNTQQCPDGTQARPWTQRTQTRLRKCHAMYYEMLWLYAMI